MEWMPHFFGPPASMGPHPLPVPGPPVNHFLKWRHAWHRELLPEFQIQNVKIHTFYTNHIKKVSNAESFIGVNLPLNILPLRYTIWVLLRYILHY